MTESKSVLFRQRYVKTNGQNEHGFHDIKMYQQLSYGYVRRYFCFCLFFLIIKHFI